MRGTKMRAATLLLVMSGLTIACDNSTGSDAGPPPMDSGQDTGTADTGTPDDAQVDAPPPEDAQVDAPTDAGPPPPHLRLAHLIPGGPSIHICLNIPMGSPTWLLITRDSVTRAPTAIPYAGISTYIDQGFPPIPIGVAVWDVADITGDACPTDTSGALITQAINGSDFASNQYYTVAATGLVGGADEQAPELVIFDDNLDAPATAGNTRIRFLNAVPNMPASAAGIDLCFDPDGPMMPMPPVELVQNITFETASTYVERAPITVGALSLHAHNPAADCLDATRLAVIPVPIPLPPTVPDNYTATFDADNTNTIFFAGNGMIVMPLPCTMPSDCSAAGPAGTTCGPAGRCTHPLAPTILPINDSFVEPAP